MIGYLTTPTAATGVSLSEFWAWVRYLSAVTADTSLRLTPSFANLDAHQKTILSDDFGMGAPMVWLTQRLNLQDVCDGRYFVERIAASIGAHNRRSAKRGPNKTPDFVARDVSGVWHVIECKGTQSGPQYLSAQLGPTNGGAQKRSIVFPPGHTGQRLVTGLQIAAKSPSDSSKLVIMDPEPKTEDRFEIGEQAMEYAEDAASRAVVARALRLAGFEATAEVTAAPMGYRAADRASLNRRVEEERLRAVEERDARAREELASRDLRETVSPDGEFQGRTLSFSLPRPIDLADGRVLRVDVRQGVNREVLTELASRPTIAEPLTGAAVNWKAARGRTLVQADGRRAEFRIGELFRAEIVLK